MNNQRGLHAPSSSEEENVAEEGVEEIEVEKKVAREDRHDNDKEHRCRSVDQKRRVLRTRVSTLCY